MRADLLGMEPGQEWGEWLRGFLVGTSGIKISDSSSFATKRGHSFGAQVLSDAQNKSASNRYKKKKDDPYLDPRWQKLRLMAMQRDAFACTKCSRSDRSLHVHHLRYVPGGSVWDSPIEDLVTLCCDCHDNAPEHKQHRAMDPK